MESFIITILKVKLKQDRIRTCCEDNELHTEHQAMVLMSSYYAVIQTVSSYFAKGHLREGKCHLSLGNAKAASRCFKKVLELEPTNREAKQEVSYSSNFNTFFPAKNC